MKELADLNMHEKILNMVLDNYKKGGVDVCDSLTDAVQTMIDMGITGPLSLQEVVDIISSVKNTHINGIDAKVLKHGP